ncbi:hypothetical protein GCK72_011338 [Caenorhabditis remanei]|uniref:RING-type domain-containing protein n=1 Tax=Caenorhabditis remanei TaxID=31234 RepID=A0A6A5H9G9_CAERE|nr:hypothetical protein GCK72_011338 [Caenorhabditis remanei]KAF1763073.1 hypothetical protein GCK72_011338 [Caenorhabditis remanei]
MGENDDELLSACKIFATWGLFAGAICLLFAPISIANWGTALAILFSWWLIPRMCSALALRATTPKLKLWSFIFACVGLTVTGFTPRIAVFIWEIPPQMLWYLTIVYPLALLGGLDHIIESSNYNIKFVDVDNYFFNIFLICNLIPLPFLIRYGISNWNFYDATVNTFIQLCFTPLSLVGTAAVGMLLIGNWEQVNSSGDRNPAPTVVQPTPARQRQPPRPIPKFKCDDCTSEYTDILIPRVLKECGHTICEDCADELLAVNNQRHLRCPVCNRITLVYGTGKMLPRNYVITDLMAMEN